MKKSFKILSIIVLVLLTMGLIVGCGGGGGGSTDGSTNTTAKWTYMVYLDGDNNLETAAYYDIFEMQEVGSDQNLNIIVQWDNYGAVDWSGCRRYEIVQDPTGSQTVVSTMVADMGNVNMGDPNTLVEFAKWGITNYPAEKYCLVLWDHGNGWKRHEVDGETVRGICSDDTSNDIITEAELVQAMSEIVAFRGSAIDVLGMDACLMGTLEVAYDMRNYSAFQVLSERSEPGTGWPHDTVLGYLKSNPTATARDFASIIVDKYRDHYSNESYNYPTLTALDSSKVGAIAQAVDVFSVECINNMDDTLESALETARTSAAPADSAFSSYRDLIGFCNVIAGSNGVTNQIQLYAAAVQSATSDAIINTWTYTAGYNGLSIWIPDSTEFSVYSNTYAALGLAQNTNYYALLQTIYNN
ncbi:MAG: clostripain-related cysteine peptidase [Vulcanimicrobiota bacterium]